MPELREKFAAMKVRFSNNAIDDARNSTIDNVIAILDAHERERGEGQCAEANAAPRGERPARKKVREFGSQDAEGIIEAIDAHAEAVTDAASRIAEHLDTIRAVLNHTTR